MLMFIVLFVIKLVALYLMEFNLNRNFFFTDLISSHKLWPLLIFGLKGKSFDFFVCFFVDSFFTVNKGLCLGVIRILFYLKYFTEAQYDEQHLDYSKLWAEPKVDGMVFKNYDNNDKVSAIIDND